ARSPRPCRTTRFPYTTLFRSEKNTVIGEDMVLEAVAFAARVHRGQARKDGETPYASHAFRVCLVLRDKFGVTDRAALAAALLHRSEEHTSELQSLRHLVCRVL